MCSSDPQKNISQLRTAHTNRSPAGTSGSRVHKHASTFICDKLPLVGKVNRLLLCREWMLTLPWASKRRHTDRYGSCSSSRSSRIAQAPRSPANYLRTEAPFQTDTVTNGATLPWPQVADRPLRWQTSWWCGRLAGILGMSTHWPTDWPTTPAWTSRTVFVVWSYGLCLWGTQNKRELKILCSWTLTYGNFQ